MHRFARRPSLLLVAIAATALVVGGIAWAAIPDSGGANNACYHTSNGKLRAVDAPDDCSGGETAIALGGRPAATSTDPGDGHRRDNVVGRRVSQRCRPAATSSTEGERRRLRLLRRRLRGLQPPNRRTTLDMTWVNLGSTSGREPAQHRPSGR